MISEIIRKVAWFLFGTLRSQLNSDNEKNRRSKKFVKTTEVKAKSKQIEKNSSKFQNICNFEHPKSIFHEFFSRKNLTFVLAFFRKVKILETLSYFCCCCWVSKKRLSKTRLAFRSDSETKLSTSFTAESRKRPKEHLVNFTRYVFILVE